MQIHCENFRRNHRYRITLRDNDLLPVAGYFSKLYRYDKRIFCLFTSKRNDRGDVVLCEPAGAMLIVECLNANLF